MATANSTGSAAPLSARVQRMIAAGQIPSPVRTVGNDMAPPYCVYVNGVEVAECQSEAEACELHSELRPMLPRKVAHG